METHTLTTAQLRKLVKAIGDGNDFPRYTDDPRVNYAVDCIVQDDGDVPPYDENLYTKEVEAFKALAKSA